MMKNHFSKTNTVLFHLYADLKKNTKQTKKLVDTEKRLVVVRGRG